jgi:hypothetical protein
VAQRIKRQEVSVLIIVDSVQQDTITDVKSFEVAFQTEVLTEGYLGETTNRKDEIFNGVKGKMTLNFENQAIFTLFQSIIDRAQRRTAGTQINIKAALNFPNGERPKIFINDVFFGELPMTFGGRSEYGEVTLDFESANARIVTT